LLVPNVGLAGTDPVDAVFGAGTMRGGGAATPLAGREPSL
jgi:hypothetical protein